MAIEIKDQKELERIINSTAVRVNGPEDDIYFNKKDVINVLSELSNQIADEKQNEGFRLAVQFVNNMGE